MTTFKVWAIKKICMAWGRFYQINSVNEWYRAVYTELCLYTCINIASYQYVLNMYMYLAPFVCVGLQSCKKAAVCGYHP